MVVNKGKFTNRSHNIAQLKVKLLLQSCLLASERSERDTIRGNKWESEIYLLASERSKRDTIRGVQIRAGAVRMSY